jgi:prevent-host-death family protein
MDRKINAAAFKAQCLKLIDEVAESGQPITVTKRGKAKVQIIAVREKPARLFGALKGSFEIVGDIVSPIFEDYDEHLDRKWRRINGQFDDPPAGYTHRTLADGGIRKAGKKRSPRVQRRPRRR